MLIAQIIELELVQVLLDVKLNVAATTFTPDNTNTSLITEAPAVFSQAQHFYIYNAGAYNSSRPTGGIGAVNSSNLISLSAGSICTANPGADGFKAYSTVSSLYDIGGGEHNFKTKSGLTVGDQFTHITRMTIKSDGNVGIGTTSPSQKLDVVGSIEVSDGIYIGGTGTANKLDDYEEGTWTPFFSGGFTGTTTFSIQKGTYTKIGRNVFFTIHIATTSATVDATRIDISTLPFTPSNATDISAGGASWSYANSSVINSTSNNLPVLHIQRNISNVKLYETDGTNFNGTDLNNPSGLDFYINGQYITD
jgi:hypothetical protein